MPRRPLADRIEARVRRAAPMWRLARADGGALRAWMRYRPAIESGIGSAEAEAYTAILVEIAATDGDLARVLAASVPDQLARVRADRRPAFFRTLREVLATRPSALPLVARTLPELVAGLDDAALRAFVAQALVWHASSAPKAESFLRRESDVSQQAARELRTGVALADVQRTLALYARAHCGEDVQVRPGSGRALTDGHHIYLPETVARFGDARDFLVYRVQTALAAGYLEFGTFALQPARVPMRWADERDGESALERWFRSFPNTSLARDLFTVLEDARVERLIRSAYPGVARDLDVLGPALHDEKPDPTAPTLRVIEALSRRARGRPALGLDAAEAAAAAPLMRALERVDELDVDEVARQIVEAYPAVEALMLRAVDGSRPPRSGSGRSAREPGRADAPVPLVPRIAPEKAGAEERRVEREAQRLVKQMEENGEQLDPGSARRLVREARRRTEETTTRFDQMESFLDRNPGPGGALVDRARTDESLPPASALPHDADVADTPAVPGGRTFRYREWDATIDDYKPRWVTVREQRLVEGSRDYVDEVMGRHRPEIDALRRRFEALRPQGLVRVRNLPDGHDLDIDRVVESEVSARAGGERLDRVYMQQHRERRDVAVAFLLDMSSSTNEAAEAGGRKIIEIEKEALIVAAEALAALGDAFAIWGFSGYGREHVAFYVAKEFGEPYDHRARERIGRIGFKMENRDGAAIRHATARLCAWPARARLLILLSDGKPLDCGCDHYFDRYAQEDTRVALREARTAGVRPFCITVDPAGPQYLARMYGDVAYTVIDRVESLPSRLIHTYRRLAL